MQEASRANRNDLRTKVLFGIVVRGLAVTISFALTVVLARLLDPYSFGIYVFALSMVQLLALPILSGLPSLLVREISQVDTDPSKVFGLVVRSLQFVLVISIVAIAASFGILQVYNIQNSSLYGTLLCAMVLMPLWAVTVIFGASFRGVGYATLGQAFETLLRPLLLIIFVAFIFFATSTYEWSPVKIMQLHAVAAAATLVVGLVIGVTILPWRSRLKLGSDKFTWLKALLPFSLIAGLQVILAKTDIIMLQLLKSAYEVGIYQIAIQLGLLAFVSKQAISMVIEPRLAKNIKQGDMRSAQIVLRSSARYLLVGAAAVSIGLILFGREIISLSVGSEYQDAYWPVVVLCVGYLFQAALGNIDTFLKMSNQEVRVAVALAGAALMNVALNSLLIPPYGPLGAAIASVAATLSYKFYLNVFSHRKVGLASHAFSRSPSGSNSD